MRWDATPCVDDVRDILLAVLAAGKSAGVRFSAVRIRYGLATYIISFLPYKQGVAGSSPISRPIATP
jgi:hypothetical protein